MMKHKGLAILIAAVLLITMIPVIAFATVDDFKLTAPTNPVYLRTNTVGYVPVTFTIKLDDDENVAARVSLMDGNDEITFETRTLHPHDRSWSGTINLPIQAGTPEGVYDIKIALPQGTDPDPYTELLNDIVIIDNTAPAATIDKPISHFKFATRQAVTISGEAIDADITGTGIHGSGVAGVAVLITGPNNYSKAPGVDLESDGNWDAEWTTPAKAGAYVITARATDEAGNAQGTAARITVYVGMDAPDGYELTMEATKGGTASAITAAPYTDEEEVVISATPKNGYKFVEWTATSGTFDDDKKAMTTFTMPDEDVTITAHFELKSSEDDEDTNDDTDEDTVAFKAAPAIAAEILKYNEIAPNAKKEKGAKGEKGMNYISEVAKKMGNGGDFNKGDKSDYDEYYDAVLEYLTDLTDVTLKDPRKNN